MPKEQMKKCPFCGSEKDVVIFSDEGRHHGMCWACLCSTDNFDSKDEALNAWNRRTP